MPYVKDTIAARATAPGKGGIGIVRISGPLAAEIGFQVLGQLPEHRYATFSEFHDDNNESIDHGIAIFFKAPDSFTGEDILELQGHGGPVVLDMLLSRIVRLGARIAEPGEFSQRAFLNDKIDLAQAEAIADLINSGTEEAARSAMRSLQGVFSNKINLLLTNVIKLRVFVEASLDFPEEEIDFLTDERVESQLDIIMSEVSSILDEASQGALLSEGASVVLIGKPNVGKSSLMNLFSGRDTSIVTNIPGTTRDLVNETVQLDGIPLRFVDTAGIRQSEDKIEAEGVRRAIAASQQANLVITLIDANQAPEQREAALLELTDDERAVIVFNKIDLVADRAQFSDSDLLVSAKTGEGLDALKARLKQQLGVQEGVESNFTARTRHILALEQAQQALMTGREVLVNHQAGELLAEELKACQQYLSVITGEFTADDLLGEIFSSFCIGK